MDYPHVRSMTTCVGCFCAKASGLLLCWPCHRREKREHDGGYSESITKTFRAIEAQQTATAILAAVGR